MNTPLDPDPQDNPVHAEGAPLVSSPERTRRVRCSSIAAPCRMSVVSRSSFRRSTFPALVLAWITTTAGVTAGAEVAATATHNGVLSVIPANPSEVCGTEHPDAVFERFQAAIARGDIPNPAARALAPVAPRMPLPAGAGANALTPKDLFIYEDSADLLSTNFSNEQLFVFMGEASAALVGKHGDNFDFIAFFLNFNADHTVGAAFYLGLENQTAGLGLNNFNRRPSYGVPGDNVEGWVNMWNVNSWSPGTGSNAGFTRLVLGQEFEHRWALFLDPIAGGRTLQGDNGPCGRGSHWNFRVDGQGSGMEIAEWVGTSPAQRLPGTLHFNSDILGVFSATDLYLMGYLSPSETNARNSELRYMDGDGGCSGSYNGPIFDFNAFQIAQTNGQRIPTAADAQKDFRVGWIMVHRPNAPPTTNDVNRALGIMEQHQTDWFNGVLGIGTLSNSIRETFGGDFDQDGDVDIDDYAAFNTCFTGADTESLGPGCEVFDTDVDTDVDLHDFGKFMNAFRGDCGVSIIDHPTGAAVCQGEPVVFSVDANGVTGGYQWTYRGIPVLGATGPSFPVNSVGPNTTGEYRVSVFGDCYTAHSDIATLTIHDAPIFTAHPEGAATCEMASVELAVTADGVPPLTYQWQFMGSDIPGANATTLIIENVQLVDLGQYRCVITDGCGLDSTSESASVFFSDPADITLQPESDTVCAGDVITLTSSSSGAATFQWFKDDEPVANGNQPFLFIPDASFDDAGTYHVVATGACNVDVSGDAVIEVITCAP